MTIVHEAPPVPSLSRRRLLLPLACLAGGFGPAIAQPRIDAPATVGGTGTGLAPLHRLAETLQLNLRSVPNLGSGGGINAVAAGAIDIALSARPPSEAERATGLEGEAWFRTAFVWAVQEKVPLKRATMAELVSLYAGRVERWVDGESVRLVLRPESDSDTQLMRNVSPDLSQALAVAAQRPGMRVAVTDDDAVADIERIAGALGGTTLAMVLAQHRRVRVLDLDGVTPGTGTLNDGRYRHAKTVYLITRANARPAVADAIRQLRAARTRDLLLQLGCLPATVA